MRHGTLSGIGGNVQTFGVRSEWMKFTVPTNMLASCGYLNFPSGELVDLNSVNVEHQVLACALLAKLDSDALMRFVGMQLIGIMATTKDHALDDLHGWMCDPTPRLAGLCEGHASTYLERHEGAIHQAVKELLLMPSIALSDSSPQRWMQIGKTCHAFLMLTKNTVDDVFATTSANLTAHFNKWPC